MKILSKETSTNKAKLFSLFYIQLFCLILMSSSFFCGDDGEMVAKCSSCLFCPEKKLSHLPPSLSHLYRLVLYSESEWAIVFFSFCVFFSSLAISHHQASERREKTFSFLSSVFPGRMNKKRQAMVIRHEAKKIYENINLSLSLSLTLIILIKFSSSKAQLHYHNNNFNI